MSDLIAPTPPLDESGAWPVRRTRSIAKRERQFLLAVVDAGLLVILSGLVARSHLGPGSFAQLAVPLVLAWLITGHFSDLYNVSTAAHALSTGLALARTVPFVAFCLLAVFFLQPYSISRQDVVLLAAASPLVVAAWRMAYVRVVGTQALDRRVLVVGAGASARALLEAVAGNPHCGITIVGLLDDDPKKLHTRVVDVEVLGSSVAMWSFASALDVEQVVLAVSSPTQDALFAGLATCYERGVAVSLMPHLYEEITGTIPVEHSGRHWLGAVPLGATGGRLYSWAKRGVDIGVSAAGLIALAPIMAVAVALVRLSSPGPVFFHQNRVGLHGRLFTVTKLRTMYVDASGQRHGAERPEVTRAGYWLRRLHLDELPQLLLILRGDMSLVGPRPKRADQARQLERSVPLYRARYSVRPGLTGWAQIRFRYARSHDDEMAKLRYDLYYIKHRSLLLDISILVRTAAQVLGMRGY